MFGDPRLPERFWRKVSVAGDCWLWTGSGPGNGYGQIWIDRRRQLTHRLAYVTLVGPIPSGLELDHLCRVRACCNPSHLEPVTRRENTLRGDGPRLRKMRCAQITECPQGHPYSEANTYVCKRGRRYCKTCQNARRRALYARTREAAKVANDHR